MKRNSKHKYSGISTFKDFNIEKSRLVRNKKFIEQRLDLNFRLLGKMASLSTQFAAMAKEQIIPKVSELIRGWENQNVKDNTAG